MKTWKKLTIYTCVIVLAGAMFCMAVMAGGPPLKDNACGVCHKDFKTILPKTHPDIGGGAAMACTSCHAPDPANKEATKFSTAVHKVHKGGKTTLECTSCHAL